MCARERERDDEGKEERVLTFYHILHIDTSERYGCMKKTSLKCHCGIN